MYLMGFSLNNLTLMALTISTGFVVDDAIVMIENIARYIERGDSPLQAALKGSKQIAFTILSLTISLIAVLIPLLFMGDVVGRLFREFALTLSITILISAVVSLTLTPMMCARLLRHTTKSEQGAVLSMSQQRSSIGCIAAYGTDACAGCCAIRRPRWSWRVGTLILTVAALRRHSQGLLSASGYGRACSASPKRPNPFRSWRWSSGSRRWPRAILDGSGRREPLLLHRRRRHQHDAQQRTDPDQS